MKKISDVVTGSGIDIICLDRTELIYLHVLNGVMVMDSKLTLKLDENVIERAKKYASNKRLSLSRLIENYLDSLTQEKEDEFEISPFVKSISSGKSIPADFDHKKEHLDYLDIKVL